MKNTIRSATTIGALAALTAASQAVFINFAGTGAYNSITTTLSATGSGTFNALTAKFNPGANASTATLTGAGGNVLNITFTSTTDDAGSGTASFSSTASIVSGTIGGQAYGPASGTLTFANNLDTASGFDSVSVFGNVNPVPEPSAFAALGLGGMALLRRRRRA